MSGYIHAEIAAVLGMVSCRLSEMAFRRFGLVLDIPMEPVFSDGFSPVDKGKIRIAAIACGCRQAIGRNVSERTGTSRGVLRQVGNCNYNACASIACRSRTFSSRRFSL